METQVSASMQAVADTIVEPRWDMEMYDWEKGWALLGLHRSGHHEQTLKKYLDRSIQTQTSAGQPSYGSLGRTPYGWDPDWAKESGEYKGIPDLAPIALIWLDHYEDGGSEVYRQAADRQFDFLQTIPRTRDGGIPMSRGSKELLTDSLWHMCPFLVRYAEVSGVPTGRTDAVTQLDVHHDRLFDPPTGLYRQAWQESPNSFAQSAFWARGVGWYTTAAIDTYNLLPSDHESLGRLADRLRITANALLQYQDRTGFWHNVVDDPEEPLETSGTLMFAYTFIAGIRLGVLDEDRFWEPAVRAIEACLKIVDDEGCVRRTAVVPGGPDAPLGVTLHGQGFYLLATNEYLKIV